MSIEGLLRELTELIVRACDPQNIVLFGSFAKGQQTVDSDIDVLVIGEFHGSPYVRGLELRQLLHGLPIRIDLHVATPHDVESEEANPLGFVCSALGSGRILYSKDEPSCRSRDT